jgi:hypothetical protein
MFLTALDFFKINADSILGSRLSIAGPSSFHAVQDAMLMPTHYVGGTPKWWLRRQQGVFANDGRHIEKLSDRRGERFIWWPGSELRKKAEGADFLDYDSGVYGGTIYLHFGHFLLDSLSRIYPFLNKFGTIKGPIFFHAQPLDGEIDILSIPHIKGIFEYLSLDREKIVLVDRPIKVKNLEYSDATFFDGIFSSLSLGWNIESKKTEKRIPYLSKKIAYVSRSKLKTGTSYISNSIDVDKLMEKKGFKVIFPETLSISEQISIFNEFDLLCGFPSSFFHLKTIAQSRPPILYFIPQCQESIHINFLNIDLSLGFNDQFCSMKAELQPTPEKFVRAFSMDIREIEHVVDSSILKTL